MFLPTLYQHHGSTPQYDAQSNLCERTHYVDDDSLRYHRAKVLGVQISDGGLLLTILESVSLDYQHTRRGFRYVTFNIFGDVVSRVDLEDCWKTKEQARKAMWLFLNTVDAKAVTLEAIEKHKRDFAEVIDGLSRRCVEQPAAA